MILVRRQLQSLSTLLHHKAYVGLKEVNKCKKDEDQSTLKAWQKYAVVKAPWPGIINQDVFDRVQMILEENQKMERARSSNGIRRTFMFTGMTFCPECSRAMTGQSAHGAKAVHRYYAHVQNRGEEIHCKIKRISADDLEQTVISHLGRVLVRGGYFEGIEKNIKNFYSVNGDKVKMELEIAEKAMTEIDLEIRGAFKIQAGVDATSDFFKLVVEQMDQLAKNRKELAERVERLKELGRDDNGLLESIEGLRERLEEFRRGWGKMTITQQKRLLRRTIARLEVYPNKVGINYFLADGKMGSMAIDSTSPAKGSSGNGTTKNNLVPFKNKKPTDSNLSVPCSRVINSGDLTPS